MCVYILRAANLGSNLSQSMYQTAKCMLKYFKWLILVSDLNMWSFYNRYIWRTYVRSHLVQFVVVFFVFSLLAFLRRNHSADMANGFALKMHSICTVFLFSQQFQLTTACAVRNMQRNIRLCKMYNDVCTSLRMPNVFANFENRHVPKKSKVNIAITNRKCTGMQHSKLHT